MLRFLEKLFAAKGKPGITMPQDTAWRKATVGDLTGAFSFGTPDASVPALPATSLGKALTYPECQAAVLTPIPGNPPSAYAPAAQPTSLPTQEPTAAGVRRPTGLAGCGPAAAAGGPAPISAAGPQAAGERARTGLASTGGHSRLGPPQLAASLAALYGLVSLRRRRDRS